MLVNGSTSRYDNILKVNDDLVGVYQCEVGNVRGDSVASVTVEGEYMQIIPQRQPACVCVYIGQARPGRDFSVVFTPLGGVCCVHCVWRGTGQTWLVPMPGVTRVL